MERYIDADALEQYFNREEWRTPDEKWWPERELGLIIDAMSTADVVEVVRCKDCKYMCHYTDGHLECRLLSDLKPIPTTYCTMNADDFCSYGERREDGNNC